MPPFITTDVPLKNLAASHPKPAALARKKPAGIFGRGADGLFYRQWHRLPALKNLAKILLIPPPSPGTGKKTQK